MFKAKVGAFLTAFLDRVSTLPSDVQRNLELVGALDKTSSSLAEDVNKLRDQYIANAKKRASEKSLDLDHLSRVKKDRAALAEIQVKHEAATEKANEKISLATHLYEMVDAHIRQLDDDLKAFETQLRAAGQLGADTDNAGAGAGNKSSRKGSKKRDRPRGKQEEDETSLTTLALTEDAPIDPNEPVYCICQRVAFGGMVGCDNDDCELEWFHFPCVGLTEKPTDMWYCPSCTAKMEAKAPRRKKRRR